VTLSPYLKKAVTIAVLTTTLVCGVPALAGASNPTPSPPPFITDTAMGRLVGLSATTVGTMYNNACRRD
jgi:hypothetical protein